MSSTNAFYSNIGYQEMLSGNDADFGGDVTLSGTNKDLTVDTGDVICTSGNMECNVFVANQYVKPTKGVVVSDVITFTSATTEDELFDDLDAAVGSLATSYIASGTVYDGSTYYPISRVNRVASGTEMRIYYKDASTWISASSGNVVHQLEISQAQSAYK